MVTGYELSRPYHGHTTGKIIQVAAVGKCVVLRGWTQKPRIKFQAFVSLQHLTYCKRPSTENGCLGKGGQLILVGMGGDPLWATEAFGDLPRFQLASNYNSIT